MTERRKTGERPILKRRRFWALAALALLVLACVLWTADYYRAGEAAQRALVSDAVRVEETDFGWLFDGPAEDAALIFYPGGKVEETAYAPLLHRLAAEGPDVFLVRMPLHLAVLKGNAADEILARYDYARWIIGGHSLGGAVAANYAASHEMDGVILLAAYPTHALDEPILLIVGSEDGVVSRERLDAASQFSTVESCVIEGGNHAGFGDYGAQKGDGAATLSPEEQQAATVQAVLAWLRETENKR